MTHLHRGTSTHAGTVKPLAYVSLRSHDGRQVILPMAVAAGSRVLHGVFQGLYVMQLHQTMSFTEGTGSVRQTAPMTTRAPVAPLAEAGAEGAGASPPVREVYADSEAVHHLIPLMRDEGGEDVEDTPATEGAEYRNFASVFPSNALCVPPSSPTPSVTAAASPSPASPPPLVTVPIRSLEFGTLLRIAEFLVVKLTLASHPHALHETDVFGDLDRTSECDQLAAMQVLLGADFLNC